MTETKYLKSVLNEIGHSVHNLNTIAVSLSNLPLNTSVPANLNIKWSPTNIEKSCISARRYAVRSSFIFAVESLFEYMCNISNDTVWKKLNLGLDFNAKLPVNNSKAKRFSEFCKSIPGIEREWYLLVEIMCHWRNQIVHASTSKARIHSDDKEFLKSKITILRDNFHHFDVNITLKDYYDDKVTLKDASTLITFLIKCCRKIDEYFIKHASNLNNQEYIDILNDDKIFLNLRKQQNSDKRSRQIKKYIENNYNYIPANKIAELLESYISF